MAIQLNDRDHLIFSLIDEHEVLLEKHISWFIAEDNKPVLIRDRLRKLFYLDYLLCHRHATKLPWWSTPTKPLVYMLSPMAKSISGIDADEVDRFDAGWQKHHLEVANVRMLYLIAQNESKIKNFHWKTMTKSERQMYKIDARASFVSNGIAYDVGIVNTPNMDDAAIVSLEAALKDMNIEMIMIISNDEKTQKETQHMIATNNNSILAKYCFFATHQDLYKDGMVSGSWQNAECRSLTLFPCQSDDRTKQVAVVPGVVRTQPLSA